MNLKAFNRVKRVIDLIVVAVSAPLTLPVGLIAGLLVRLNLGSPVLFTQRRVGLCDVEFDVLKFRTMTDARDSSGELLPDSDRLTTFGRVLRSTSLDELPQLINVVRGDMSLVGPRPLFARYLSYYSAVERCRHAVRPGITGLAQVSGRNSVGWDRRLAYDVKYVQQASLVGDLRILIGTLLQVAKRQNVAVLASESGEPLDVERSYPTDGTVKLRRLRESDLPKRVEWVSDPRVRQHMQWPDGITIDSTRKWFAQARRDKQRIDYLAECDESAVAMAGLRKSDAEGRTAEFYVFVDPSKHHQGYGQGVTALVLRHAFEQWGLDAVTLTVSRDNTAARRIYESLGFVIVGSDEERVLMRCQRP